jgi:hypothetical protein
MVMLMGWDYPIGPSWLQGLAQPPWFLKVLGKPAGGGAYQQSLEQDNDAPAEPSGG